MLVVHSPSTTLVFMMIPTALVLKRISTTLSCLSVGVLRMARTTGSSRTVGLPTGVKRVMSRLLVTITFAVLPLVPTILFLLKGESC